MDEGWIDGQKYWTSLTDEFSSDCLVKLSNYILYKIDFITIAVAIFSWLE